MNEKLGFDLPDLLRHCWEPLEKAGFISGNPADAGVLALPTNAWDGLMGVTIGAMGNNLTGTKVCLSQVPGSAAISIDNELDDGLGASGRLRATVGTGGANTNPKNAAGLVYSEDNEYTICRRI
mgnify:CR=1 FL=1